MFNSLPTKVLSDQADVLSGLIWIQTDILIVYLKEIFRKVDFEKNQQMTKKHVKFPRMQRVKYAMIHLTQSDIQA